jgi:hypothetical protein
MGLNPATGGGAGEGRWVMGREEGVLKLNTNLLNRSVPQRFGAYNVAIPQAKQSSTSRNMPVILNKSAMVRRNETSIVPRA